ncbi:MAG TPA: hypothetical protein VJG67_00005 [Candidatus Paceibacterota bacterium]
MNKNEKENEGYQEEKNYYTRYQALTFRKHGIFFKYSFRCLFVKRNKSVGNKNQEKNRDERCKYCSEHIYYLKFVIKNFSFPQIWFKPMFLTGSLAVFIGAAPPHFQNFVGDFPRRLRRLNAFRLIQEYCTSKEFASSFCSPRFARRLNCKEFWAKKSVGDLVFLFHNIWLLTRSL